jgi:hypothetical protein
MHGFALADGRGLYQSRRALVSWQQPQISECNLAGHLTKMITVDF